MNFYQFKRLIQPRSKVASIMPFTVGLLFTWIVYQQIDFYNTILFFFAMLIFDMTTSSINVVMDYFKSDDQNYRENINAIGRTKMDVTIAVIVTVTQLVIAVALSLLLVVRVGWLLLFVGMFCFAVGIFYTYGPLPISRLPISDFFAGFTMGFVIPFLTVLVNINTNEFAELLVNWPNVNLNLNLEILLKLLLISFPAVVTTFNMKLANDLCDVEEDKINHRYTLPVVVGVKKALSVYQVMPYLGYLAIFILVVIDFRFWPVLIILITLPKVHKNIEIFKSNQIKSKTYITANFNLFFETLATIAGLLLTAIIQKVI